MRFVAVIIVLASVACSRQDETSAMPKPDEPAKPAARIDAPKVVITTPQGDRTVNVEVVSSDAKIERGLMYRQHLPLDGGMLFLMPNEKVWTFWMHNTLIPLDMIFIKRDMTIAGVVENAEPKTDTLRKVDAPTLYVLEVNGGWTRTHGVTAGAKVRFDNVR